MIDTTLVMFLILLIVYAILHARVSTATRISEHLVEIIKLLQQRIFEIEEKIDKKDN